MAEQSSRCLQRLFISARPAPISPDKLCSVPSATRAAPTSPPWGREGSARGTLCWWPSKGRSCRGRQLETSGATAVSRRGVPEERGGLSVAFPLCSGPVPTQEPRAGSSQGLSQVGQVPWFCSEPPCPAPRPGRGVGSGCGASQGGREG